MAENGFNLGTAWIQIAPSMRGVGKTVSRELGDVDTKPAERKIEGRIGGAFTRVASIAKTALATATTVGLAAGFTVVAKEAIRASDATDKFKSTLTFADLDSGTIESLTKATKKYADETVYELSDIQSITAQLASNGVADFDKLAVATGNLNAVAGGNAQTFGQVGLMLTQTAGAGKLTTENWNQLADAIPGASGKLQEAMRSNGAFTGNFRDAMEKGQISAEEFNTAILQLGMTDVAAEAATSTKTIEGAWGNLMATFVSGGMGLVDRIKPALTGAMEAISSGAETAFKWIDSSLIPSMESIWNILTKGDFTGNIFGFDEDSALVDFLFNTREAVSAVWTILRDNVIPGVSSFLDSIVSSAAFPVIGSFFGSLISNKGVVLGVVGAFVAWKSVMAGFRFGQYTASVYDSVKAWVLKRKALAAAKAETVALRSMYAGDFLRNLAAQAAAVARSAAAWVRDTAAKVANRAVGMASSIAATGHALAVQSATLVRTVAAWVAQRVAMVAARAASLTYAAAQWALNAALNANPLGLIVLALAAFVGAIVLAWKNSETFRNIVLAAWDAIKTGAAILWGGIKTSWDAIGNIVKGVSEWISGTAAPAIVLAWDVIKSGAENLKARVVLAWELIKTGVALVYSWIRDTLVGGIQGAWDRLTHGAQVLRDGVVGAWDQLKTGVNSVKDWFLGALSSAIDRVFRGVSRAAEGMKDGVAKAWDGIKAAAAKPVNFMINTVYTNGVKLLADKIADKLGLDLKLPAVSGIAGYARGGVLPGYTPGRDVHRFLSPTGGALELSGGEAIMRPEWVRAVGGPAAIERMNAAARSGRRVPGGDTGTKFADGGIWDRIKQTVGGAVDGAGDWLDRAADAVSSIIMDPIGAVTNLVASPVKALVERMGGSGLMFDIAKDLPGKWVSGFGEWLSGKTAGMSASNLVDQARLAMGVPYVWGGASIPPGLDCSGLIVWALRQMGNNVPRLTAAGFQRASTPGARDVPGNLLFWGNPAWHVAVSSGNGMMVEAPRTGMTVRETRIWGNPTSGIYKYDDGGMINPGLSAVVNKTRRPERVFTDGQWGRIDRLIELLLAQGGGPQELILRDVDNKLIGRMRVEADDRIVTAFEMVS